MSDKVFKPAHYLEGKHETIDFLTGWGYGYCFGNTIKYLTRYRLKNGDEDLQKALWYLNRGFEEKEIGFKKIGSITAESYVKSKNIDDEVKSVIEILHKGIHMKRMQYVAQALEGLEDFIASRHNEVNGK